MPSLLSSPTRGAARLPHSKMLFRSLRMLSAQASPLGCRLPAPSLESGGGRCCGAATRVPTLSPVGRSPLPRIVTTAATLSGDTNTALLPSRFSTLKPGVKILGIETSCDETGAAVVTAEGRVLGEALASQAAIHAQWGGVVPKLAQGAHEEAIDRIVEEALANAGVHPSELDAVAVTVGVVKARWLAAQHRLPLVQVHHMEAHTLVARLEGEAPFPFLGLLISGGHNLLVVVKGVGNYEIIGASLDDALGEAYDKVARMLGLDVGGGGGRVVEELAREGDDTKYPLPVPMFRKPNCDFSFAGLKTAVRLAIEEHVGVDVPPSADNRQVRADIAACFQRVAVKHLEQRTRRAIQWTKETHPDLTSIVVAGGVASNKVVRAQLMEVSEEAGLPLVVPQAPLCTDNGVMVAWAGMERFALGFSEPPPTVQEAEEEVQGLREVQLKPRWPLGDKDPRGIQNVKAMKQQRQFPSLTAISGPAVSL